MNEEGPSRNNLITKGLLQDGEWIPSLEKPMRVSIIAALSALTCLTMVSFASAQNNQGVSRPPDETANHSPPAPELRDGTGPKLPGLTVEEESAIPYRPCTEALGWVSRHLRCYNN